MRTESAIIEQSETDITELGSSDGIDNRHLGS